MLHCKIFDIEKLFFSEQIVNSKWMKAFSIKFPLRETRNELLSVCEREKERVKERERERKRESKGWRDRERESERDREKGRER